MSKVMQQDASGKWVEAVPLPTNYGAVIPDEVRNDPAALEAIKAATGWDPHCRGCGVAARAIGVSWCEACSAVERQKRLKGIEEWCKEHLNDPQLPPRESLTCNGCKDNGTCKFAWDPYNTDGDCLASK